MEDKVRDIFGDWNETMIWSCLQGVMGKIYTNDSNDAAMAVLGDFIFYAGRPDGEFVRFRPEGRDRDFAILVPQTNAWAELIESSCGSRAKKVTRYAIKKEKDIFNADKLRRAAESLPEEYELRMIKDQEYALCQSTGWAKDLVSQFKDYDMYRNLGLGAAVYKGGELVSGASSYSRYKEGIEIEIDTREDHRRKGLAYACGAKLILACLEKGLYPSWDAHNKWSVALAEKLGYHFSHEYTAYEMSG